MSIEIGNWVIRTRSGSKWHLVDSTVADRVVTRCGRELELSAKKKLKVSNVMPLTRAIGQPQLCKAGCE